MTVELKEQEKAVLEKMAEGATYEICGREMGFSGGYAKRIAYQLMQKIGADNITQAVAIGFREGWLK